MSLKLVGATGFTGRLLLQQPLQQQLQQRLLRRNAAAAAHLSRRMFSAQPNTGAEAGRGLRDRNMNLALYATAVVVGVAGLSYAAVPLYQMFCQATGYGGTTQQATEEQFKNMKPVVGAKPLTVSFAASTSSSMPWKFVPQQSYVRVVPGETALAFFTAYNPTDTAVTGVSTYNVTPARAGLYFHKIQCFCFEEQRLRPHEEIDMPVFFYVDPEFLNDPSLAGVRTITLSYTFFRTGDQEVIRFAEQAGGPLNPDSAPGGVVAEAELSASERVRNWTREVAERTGATVPEGSVAQAVVAGGSERGAAAAVVAPGENML